MSTEYTRPNLDFGNDALHNLPDEALLRAYWVYTFVSRPWLVNLGSKIGGWSVSVMPPARWAVKKTIFAQFCGGESVQACRPTMQRLAQNRIHTILDYSVEGAETEANFNHTLKEIEGTIHEAARSKDVAFSVFKVTGLGPSSVLEAASKLAPDAPLPSDAQKVAARVDRLCSLAHQLGVRIFIDAEETWLQPFIDRLAVQAMQVYNNERAIVFNTYQLYLQDGLDRLRRDAELVWATGAHFGTKLVRGAYMEKEGSKAAAQGRPSPVNVSKPATDQLFNQAASFCLDHIERSAFCLGTHNADSCRLIVDTMADRGIAPNDSRIWFAQLLGMSDNLSYPLAEAGYNVAKYVPYGPVKEVVPYLIRRAQENTSVAGQSGRELSLTEAEVKRRGLSVWKFFS